MGEIYNRTFPGWHYYIRHQFDQCYSYNAEAHARKQWNKIGTAQASTLPSETKFYIPEFDYVYIPTCIIGWRTYFPFVGSRESQAKREKESRPNHAIISSSEILRMKISPRTNSSRLSKCGSILKKLSGTTLFLSPCLLSRTVQFKGDAQRRIETLSSVCLLCYHMLIIQFHTYISTYIRRATCNAWNFVLFQAHAILSRRSCTILACPAKEGIG